MIPETIPVMTLPGTVFFPRTMLPLHIFEQRYRHMLSEILETHRVFAVALQLHEGAGPDRETPHRIATAGLVRACQKNSDGTSNLLLEGLSRIKILEVVSKEPFRRVRVERLEPPAKSPVGETLDLHGQLLALLRAQGGTAPEVPQQLTDTLEEIDDPSVFCDLLVFSLVDNPRFKQRMLELIDPVQRLRRTLAYFRAERERRRLGEHLQGGLSDEEIGCN